MSISIKTAREIEKMRRAGELLEKVHDELGRAIHPGMSAHTRSVRSHRRQENWWK